MKYFLMVLLVLCAVVFSSSRPNDQVEIEKQRLLRFPDETHLHLQYQTPEQTEETRRILEEIKKINIALGYVKNPHLTTRHPSHNLLDPDTFLYHDSKPSYPMYANTFHFSGTLRNLKRINQPIVARKIIHHHSLMLPQPDSYFYPIEHLRIPTSDSLGKLNDSSITNSTTNSTEEIKPQKLMAISNDVTSIIEYSPSKFSNNDLNQMNTFTNDEYRNLLLNNIKKIVKEAESKRSKSNKEPSMNKISTNNNNNNRNNHGSLILVPSQLQNLATMQKKSQSAQMNPSLMTDVQSKHSNQSEIKLGAEDKSKIKQVLKKFQESTAKGPFGFLRPRPQLQQQQQQNTTPQKINLIQHITNRPSGNKQQQNNNTPVANKYDEAEDDDNDDDDDEENDDDDKNYDDGSEKGIFLAHRKEMQDTQKQALKDGGIIIQRLKVRKGGIAIAGPGGVATAGSGGTAIVGPGGVALTHPKSLTIAGPGAKVLALPESYDLEKAILKAKGKNFPEEGRLVATGPAIYYHPENFDNVEEL